MKNIIQNAATAAIWALYYTERGFYYHTGVMLPFLRKAWDEVGEYNQKSLNRRHGTDIVYGWIKR